LIRINFPFLSYLEIKVGELFTLEITLTYWSSFRISFKGTLYLLELKLTSFLSSFYI
jgi:hypothetical protein